jgi:hypothetical protein
MLVLHVVGSYLRRITIAKVGTCPPKMVEMSAEKHISYPLVNKQFAIENCPFIDVLPIKNGDFPYSYVSLPEGTS